MKKLLVLLLALCFVGGFAFADPAAFAPTLSVSGYAKVTFGVNLDKTAGNGVATGLANEADGDITLTLVPAVSDEKGGKEGEEVYGYIKLKTIKIVLDDDDGTVIKFAADGIDAKIYLGPVYIDIRGSGAGTGKAYVSTLVQDYDDNDNQFDFSNLPAAASTKTVSAGKGNLAATGTTATGDNTTSKGIVLGLKDTSVVDVKIGVLSRYSYNDTTFAYTYKLDTSKSTATAIADVSGNNTASAAANSSNLYTFWASVDLKAVENLSVGVKVALDSETVAASTVSQTNANPFGLSVGASYKIPVAEGIAISPMAAFDINFTQATTPAVSAAPAWILSAGVKVDLPGSKKDDWTKFGGKVDIIPGFALGFALDSGRDASLTLPTNWTGGNNIDLNFAFFDGTLIPVLDLVALVELYGINKGPYANGDFGVFASADFGQVVPYAGFQMYNLQSNAILQVGADIKVITNTVFTLAYKTGDLTAKDAAGAAKPGLGTIELTAKISY